MWLIIEIRLATLNTKLVALKDHLSASRVELGGYMIKIKLTMVTWLLNNDSLRHRFI